MPPRLCWIATTAAVVLAATGPRAGAQDVGNHVIDQQNAVATGAPFTIDQPFDFVRQTFTPTASQISGFGISFAGPITTATSFNVLVGLANGSEGPLLNRLYTFAPGDGARGFDALFSTPAALRPGELYVIALGFRYGSLGFLTGAGDAYPRGGVSVNGQEVEGADLVFRTYAPAATVVPEPATVVLVGAGLVAAGLGRRRRSAG